MDILFINLKILGKIQENQKLSSSQGELISSIYRWLCNESRYITLSRIRLIIKEAINCGDNAIKSTELNNSTTDRNLEMNELEEQIEIRKWENTGNTTLQMNK